MYRQLLIRGMSNRHEYMTNVILVISILVLVPSFIVLTILWTFGLINGDIPLATLLIICLFQGGLFLSQRGFWYVSSFIPSLFILIICFYSTIYYGTTWLLAIQYSIFLLFSSIMLDVRARWLALVCSLGGVWLSLISYSYGRPAGMDFSELMSRNIIIMIYLVLFSLLLFFYTTQFQKALQEALELQENLKNDIQKRMALENDLSSSLCEKEVLLREVHHRVKNNLQIVSSLLSLHASRIDDESSREKLQLCQARIHSISLIHEQLYQSEDLGHLNIAEFTKSLTRMMGTVYSNSECELITAESDINLGMGQAVPLGLIIHELVANSLKHAFQENECGRITIDFRRDTAKNTVSLHVSDNGKGLPKDFSIPYKNTLGFIIVDSLVSQLQGSIEFHLLPATFIITFPYEERRDSS